jgi:glycosyltransferase involved in cell wall biosynthesis
MREPSPEPYFSIIVPTYNRGHLIARTLESLLAQTDPSFEVIVVDDGSTDDTESVVRRFTDVRLHYHRKANAERGAARNYGAARARGSYLNFFDSDDLAYPHHLTEARRMIAARMQPALFHLRFDLRNGDGVLMGVRDRLADPRTGQISHGVLLRGNRLSCNGVFIRQDVARAHPFDEERALAGTEDWILWLRLAARFPFWESDGVFTTSLVEHDARSVAVAATLTKSEARALTAEACLARDPEFLRSFGESGLDRVRGSMQSYTALHAAIGDFGTRSSLRHLFGAIRSSPRELFQRRTAAIFKHLLKHRVQAGLAGNLFGRPRQPK